MLFINWWLVGEFTLALLMIAGGVIGLRKARNQPVRLARVAIRLVCVPLMGLGTLAGLLLFLITVSGCERSSAPIYSPSGRIAVRVYNLDGGATDGSTSVDMFWAKGFRRTNIFTGPWGAVEPSDIHWISDSEMTISTDVTAHQYYCGSTAVVKIICTPK